MLQCYSILYTFGHLQPRWPSKPPRNKEPTMPPRGPFIRTLSSCCCLAGLLLSAPAITPAATDFTMTVVDNTDGDLRLFLYTPKTVWSEQENRWKFSSSDIIMQTEQKICIDPEELENNLNAMNPILFPTPRRLEISSRSPSELSYNELRYLSPSRHGLIEIFHRFSFPFLMFILIIASIPFSVNSDKNVSVFLGVGISLGIIFLCYSIVFAFLHLGGKGMIPPWGAAFIPFMLFVPPSAFIYSRIKT